jgi:hypothetical protein
MPANTFGRRRAVAGFQVEARRFNLRRAFGGRVRRGRDDYAAAPVWIEDLGDIPEMRRFLERHAQGLSIVRGDLDWSARDSSLAQAFAARETL